MEGINSNFHHNYHLNLKIILKINSNKYRFNNNSWVAEKEIFIDNLKLTLFINKLYNIFYYQWKINNLYNIYAGFIPPYFFLL